MSQNTEKNLEAIYDICDRLYTDIASGVNAKVDTLFVLSGEGTLSDIDESEFKPAFVADNAADIAALI